MISCSKSYFKTPAVLEFFSNASTKNNLVLIYFDRQLVSFTLSKYLGKVKIFDKILTFLKKVLPNRLPEMSSKQIPKYDSSASSFEPPNQSTIGSISQLFL